VRSNNRNHEHETFYYRTGGPQGRWLPPAPRGAIRSGIRATRTGTREANPGKNRSKNGNRNWAHGNTPDGTATAKHETSSTSVVWYRLAYEPGYKRL
jgi:hypothetical protein